MSIRLKNSIEVFKLYLAQCFGGTIKFLSIFLGDLNTVGGLIGAVVLVFVVAAILMFGLPKYNTWLVKESSARVEYEELKVRRIGAALRDYPLYIEYQKVENE